jgi:hypothetical protein
VVAVAPGPTNPAAGELWQLITRLAHRTADTRRGKPAPAS